MDERYCRTCQRDPERCFDTCNRCGLLHRKCRAAFNCPRVNPYANETTEGPK